MRIIDETITNSKPTFSEFSEITLDSTLKQTMDVTHKWVCCWHENLGGQWPWYSNPTAYACLSWDETNGTTWDTLISPRINLAGCSSIVFRQSSYSNLFGILEKKKMFDKTKEFVSNYIGVLNDFCNHYRGKFSLE